MKEEKELSPRGGEGGGNLLSCPQNEMGGEEEGEKKEKEWTGRETDPDIHPRGMYIKPTTGTIATEE